MRTAPRATWEAFNDEDEAWNWITTRSVTDTAESSKRRVFKRESSIIDLSSSRSASPEQRRPQHSPPVLAPDIKSRHVASEVIDLDPESPPACKEDPDIDVANETSFPKPEPEITLSDEQLEVVRICEGGENLFFTGSAGSFYISALLGSCPGSSLPRHRKVRMSERNHQATPGNTWLWSCLRSREHWYVHPQDSA
jgi:hypothetical protein